MTGIYELDKYTMPVTHIISEYIREYDISKANINILLYKGLINKKQYDSLYNDPYRRIKVGLMQRDNATINKGLMEGFVEARKMFYEANNIQEHEILAVKKDAIFLLNKIASHTKFDNINFIEKNLYTSFYHLGGLELYYFYNPTTKQEKLDIKGMSDNVIELHKPYMVDLLMYIFGTAQESPSRDVVNLISNIRSQYIAGELGVNYFREFNNRSLFRSKINILGERMYLTCLSANVQAKDIDPAYNFCILQELYKIFAGQYLKNAQNKR
jgi:hypothetical protein